MRSATTPAIRAGPVSRHSSARRWAAYRVVRVPKVLDRAASVMSWFVWRIASHVTIVLSRWTVSRSCHNTTANKVVYFKNPSYPQSDTQQNFCDLTVNINDPDICQLRIDFLDFQLDQPTRGDCLGDKFRISSSGFAPTSVPVLCGLNRNQHSKPSIFSNS